MCLEQIREPQNKKGIGYKIVRVTDNPDEYKPYYKYFSTDGFGGCKVKLPHNKPTRVIYKIGRWYCVGHRVRAQVDMGNTYYAGVHMYKSYQYAQNAKGSNEGLAVIAFKYTQAIAEDTDVIVAMRVKPVRHYE
jgi:hypothetical protein